MNDKLELLGEEDGIAKTVERVPPPSGQALQGSSYRITLKLPPDKEVTALFSGDAMDALVQFIGYPRPTDVVTCKEAAEMVAAEVNTGDALRAELGLVRSQVRTLLASLQDAWWLNAASAYDILERWLDDRLDER